MPEYYCNLCNFTTKYKKDLIRHNETKKHKVNVYNDANLNDIPTQDTHKSHTCFVEKKSNICKHCKTSFSRPDSLIRHYKVCIQKCDESYQNELKSLQQKLKLSEKQNKQYKQECKRNSCCPNYNLTHTFYTFIYASKYQNPSN